LYTHMLAAGWTVQLDMQDKLADLYIN
jgi:hypothetical protein